MTKGENKKGVKDSRGRGAWVLKNTVGSHANDARST